MKKIILSLIAFLPLILLAQTNKTYLEYIDLYKGIAIQEMNKYRIPASITLAQGLLESGAGKSVLATEGNNHFGIKCQNNWTGETIHADDDALNECFRKYPSPEKSYEDHSQFLLTRKRYASLFELETTDYKGWAHGLKKAGYATNPNYAPQLIKLIEDYNLQQYDKPVKDTEKIVEKPVASPDSVNYDQSLATRNKTYIAEINAYRVHEIKKINGVKYVIAMPGDTYESIAEEFDMFEKELLKANEVKYGENPQPGDIVFISKKKKKGNVDSVVAKEGQTMYQISQQQGIRVRELYELNKIIYGTPINAGDVIKLR
jgi:uncharacterized FlgJ-related protein